MGLLRSLVPQTLVGRVFALYAANLLLFVGAGLGLFYHYQFVTEIESAAESAQLLSEVVAQTVTDSVVIGDYDTVKRMLRKTIQRSPFADASFIDLQGGVITAAQPAAFRQAPPRWLSERVAAQLHDINNVIAVGGRDYGVLRLRFAPEYIAGEIWAVTLVGVQVCAVALLVGLLLIRFLLRRWLGGLDRIGDAAALGPLADTDPQSAMAKNAPVEIRAAIDAFRRTGAELRVQRETAAVTLTSIADGVITTDGSGRIVYVNPAAARVLHRDADSLLRHDVRELLPTAFGERAADAFAPWSGKRIDLASGAGEAIVLDTTFSPIAGAAGETIGHVLAWRDVTEAQKYEDRLRGELDTRQAALHELRDALKGMLPESSLGQFAISDSDLGAVSRLVAQLVREREAGHRALDNQKFALDQHASVSIADADGNITYANQKFSEVTGYAISELLRANHRITASGLHPPAFFRDMWRTIASGRVWHGEIANRHKSGSLYWVATTIVPWLDDGGRPYQYIAIRTDITPQKKVEHALADARRRELETGHEIQRSLLIGDLPVEARVAEVASYTEPSQGIDGDFFAFTTFRPNCLELLVGDVMGKGVPAALIGAAVRTAYNQVVTELLATSFGSRELPPPAEIVNALHRKLTPRLIGLDSFVTMALYRFDFDYAGGTIRYVNAGHTPGMLIRSDGSIGRILGDNLPVGVLADEHYVEKSEVVGAGDALLVYSDGITEARDPDGVEFGEERLHEFIANTAGRGLPTNIFLQALRRTVTDFAGASGMLDDQTAVMVGLRSPGADHEPEVFDLPWDSRRLEPLRRRVAAAAAALGAEAADGLVLAAFEAATNVVRHVAPPFRDAAMSCRIVCEAERVTVEIWYLGEGFQPAAAAAPDLSGNSEGGFGLYIMSQAVTSVVHDSPLPGICRTRLIQSVAEAVRG